MPNKPLSTPRARGFAHMALPAGVFCTRSPSAKFVQGYLVHLLLPELITDTIHIMSYSGCNGGLSSVKASSDALPSCYGRRYRRHLTYWVCVTHCRISLGTIRCAYNLLRKESVMACLFVDESDQSTPTIFKPRNCLHRGRDGRALPARHLHVS